MIKMVTFIYTPEFIATAKIENLKKTFNMICCTDEDISKIE